jgi:splicing factor 3B subunit 3
MLTIYVLDLGLNNVVRHSTETIDETANMLISVPGGDGPGGYCILCEDYLIYRNLKGEKKVKYPKRVGAPTDRG